MSNPLLKPNDPRFEKPEIHDTAGKNRFGEDEPAAGSPPSTEVYAAASEGQARPFVPQYEVQQHSRPVVLFVLGAMGWCAAAIGVISLTGVFDIGWIGPLLGVIPAGGAWLLSHEELKQISVGVIAAEARGKVQHAYWLGVTALVACVAIVAAMIYHRMNFWPDL
jgi:hypothetical protein